MNDPGGEGEPTMEEILASIRKIISEDDAEGQGVAETQETTPEPKTPDEGVLELTERVEQADPESVEEQEIDAILASVTESEDSAPSVRTPGAGSGGLLSPKTDTAVTSKLADFAGTLAQENAAGSGGTTTSLDTLVHAALEPYLKSWLDENLEPLVERVVREELKRMARRAEDL
jgi:cell pole-organizing protein PopZ